MDDIKRYSWNFDGDAEIWGNDDFDTIEECLVAAKEEAKQIAYYPEEIPAEVYIGENQPFVPWADAENVLDTLQEQAAEFAGEVGCDWDAYDYKKQSELNELSEKLSDVVREWFKKYGYEPHFYAINNIKKYRLYWSENDG